MKFTWPLISLGLFTASAGANYLTQIYGAPRVFVLATGGVAMLALLSVMAWIWVSISKFLEKISTGTSIPMYKDLYGRNDDEGE
ncbi:hypothetical protein [Celeribacter neptunius]|uniref:Uncharacterized protein n=1 Tax=Celeribacter neptunius TaxID=588602 RepID=A0A1I3J5K4_9RHOB|nr:hypothetical protein [Celeribacter neptunius]SFI55552.1 hypothetical protein SAMN04487991_0246 [Celeribacter neptunius]